MRGSNNSNYMKQKQDKIIDFISNIYMDACLRARNKKYSASSHEQWIIKMMQKQKISLADMSQYLGYGKNQILADVIEVVSDMRVVLGSWEQYRERFLRRAGMHLGGAHYKNLLLQSFDQKAAKKVLKMYQNYPTSWDEQKQKYFKQAIYPNCVYLMGLSKGNGVILENRTLLSCAHVFQSGKMIKIRCFATGAGQYGIVRLRESGYFTKQDLCFGQIIKFQCSNTRLPVELKPIPTLKFLEEFKPFQCIQVGLLYIPEQEHIQTFETAQGFIQRNQYHNQQDLSLDDQKGKLIHNCYGMWGTSGSPLWDNNGNLIGLHNAWNSQGHNISMLVHDEERDQCRAIRQYERRAISIHVIHKLYTQWKNFANQGSILNKKNQIKQQQVKVVKTKLIQKTKYN